MSKKQPKIDTSAEKIPELLPILPLFDAALFPKMVLPLVVLQGESIQLIDEAMSRDRIIGLLVSKEPGMKAKYTGKDLYRIGTSALILKMAKTEENKAQMLVQGLRRFRVKAFVTEKPYVQARIEPLKDVEIKDKETEALMSNTIGQFTRIVELSPGLPQELGQMSKSIQEAGTLADMVTSTINSTLTEKQNILETIDVKKRLKEVSRLASHQIEILELGNKIQSQVRGDMDKQQKEFYLRQQLKAIKEELGERTNRRSKSTNTGIKSRKKTCPGKQKKKQNAN